MLIGEFFKLQSDSEMNIAAYGARIEELLSDMNTELRQRGTHDTPFKLLHGQILATEEPQYLEFSNVWESLDDKLTTNGLLEKLCIIEKQMHTSTTAEQSRAFLAPTSIRMLPTLANKTSSSKPSG
jgi:hypothetical protein